MDVHSFLLGVLPDIKIMVAERTQTGQTRPAHPKVSPSVPGGTRVYTLKEESFNARLMRQPTGNVGQHAKDNSHSIKHKKWQLF